LLVFCKFNGRGVDPVFFIQSDLKEMPAETALATEISSYSNSTTKRAFDLVVSGVALVFLMPFLLLLYVIVRLEGGAPALFRHTRIGRNGKAFSCLKFRTMVVDADRRLEELLRDPVVAAEWRETQKLRNDPRITRIGVFLRRTSLDELPQLWNIFVGDMSLVGPRPVTRTELSRYGAIVGCYLAVRPGLTGPWQVGGRSNTTFSYRVELDRRYSINSSFFGDIGYLLRTVRVVFGDRSAA
jgi:lipopolysaccharide/colanic/teichoic acid biosynthesis glycosyltransferase